MDDEMSDGVRRLSEELMELGEHPRLLSPAVADWIATTWGPNGPPWPWPWPPWPWNYRIKGLGGDPFPVNELTKTLIEVTQELVSLRRQITQELGVLKEEITLIQNQLVG